MAVKLILPDVTPVLLQAFTQDVQTVIHQTGKVSVCRSDQQLSRQLVDCPERITLLSHPPVVLFS